MSVTEEDYGQPTGDTPPGGFFVSPGSFAIADGQIEDAGPVR